MELILYRTMDDENVINKSMVQKGSMNIKIKNIVDVMNPIIILKDVGMYHYLECNYAYLSDFERYYFIRSIENMSAETWQLTLECDVLETFKEDILNSTVEVTRGLKTGEYALTNLEVETIRDIDIYKSDITLNDKKNIILSTIGGV